MKEFFTADKNRILNVKYKKFKNLKKNYGINRIHLNNFFLSPYKEVTMACRKIYITWIFDRRNFCYK